MCHLRGTLLWLFLILDLLRNLPSLLGYLQVDIRFHARRHFLHCVNQNDAYDIVQGKASRAKRFDERAYGLTSCNDRVKLCQLFVELGVKVTQTLIIHFLNVVQGARTL